MSCVTNLLKVHDASSTSVTMDSGTNSFQTSINKGFRKGSRRF